MSRAELDDSGLYMTIHVGGPLGGDVMLEADVAERQVSVTARWTAADAHREARVTGMPMTDAEELAAQWADELSAGQEPHPTNGR
ncbi:MAG TPA: hypothetical protein VHX66_00665 [Solirubrobacteraceae bacterium]|nr:hypothetical protein [Solirubrobacteraceae bacterium]